MKRITSLSFTFRKDAYLSDKEIEELKNAIKKVVGTQIEITKISRYLVFKCNKCKETGIVSDYICRGAHFGGSVKDELHESFCDCEFGKKKIDEGYELKVCYV